MTQTVVVTARSSPSTYGGWVIGSDSGDTTGDTRPEEEAYRQAQAAFGSQVAPAKDTPCVAAKPTEAPLATINSHAAGAVNTIRDSYPTQRELISIIYFDEGQVSKLLPQTSNQFGYT